MEKQFYSNINCAACVAKVTDALDSLVGSGHWEVNTADRNKPLTLQTDQEISPETLNEKLAPLGYQVRPVQP